MDFPALYTVLKLAKKENEDENKQRHSARVGYNTWHLFATYF
ncbi:hypothetical protein SF274771_5087 [Shigella flexneri 2747-71]|nr:hypothetical protein SF274771_5087 [Shigella flexneri 2747-71]EGK28497.1 hypothetical protein SFK218_0048 [Shigella flexneri K-218]EIQ02866.1 hypothetical protein SF285071_5035 [Shigella flexneri 2850-71]EIQ19477.1 hypothetical protein SFK404_5440 [Shigella flexneri K-404]